MPPHCCKSAIKESPHKKCIFNLSFSLMITTYRFPKAKNKSSNKCPFHIQNLPHQIALIPPINDILQNLICSLRLQSLSSIKNMSTRSPISSIFSVIVFFLPSIISMSNL